MRHRHIVLKDCPFNATHRVPPEDFVEHIMSCPQRQTIENHRYFCSSTQSSSVEDEMVKDAELPGAEENEFFLPPPENNSRGSLPVAPAAATTTTPQVDANPGTVDWSKKLGMGRGRVPS